MKTITQLFVLLACCLATTIVPAQEPDMDANNLLKNPKLDGTGTPFIPFEWKLGNSGELAVGDIQQDLDTGEGDKTALRIEHPAGGGHYTQVLQHLEISKDKKYVLRARAKTENLLGGPGSGMALIGLYTVEGNTIGFQRVDSQGEWIDIEVLCDPSAATTTRPDTAQVIIYLDASEGVFSVSHVGLFEADSGQ